MSALDHELIRKEENIHTIAHQEDFGIDYIIAWLEQRRLLAILYSKNIDENTKEYIKSSIEYCNEQIKVYLLL